MMSLFLWQFSFIFTNLFSFIYYSSFIIIITHHHHHHHHTTNSRSLISKSFCGVFSAPMTSYHKLLTKYKIQGIVLYNTTVPKASYPSGTYQQDRILCFQLVQYYQRQVIVLLSLKVSYRTFMHRNINVIQ